MGSYNRFFLKFIGVEVGILGVWCVLLSLLQPHITSGIAELVLFYACVYSHCLGAIVVFKFG